MRFICKRWKVNCVFYTNNRDEYESLHAGLIEYSKQFYTGKLYSWFVKWIDREI